MPGIIFDMIIAMRLGVWQMDVLLPAATMRMGSPDTGARETCLAGADDTCAYRDLNQKVGTHRYAYRFKN